MGQGSRQTSVGGVGKDPLLQVRGFGVLARRVEAGRSGNHQTWFPFQPCTYLP